MRAVFCDISKAFVGVWHAGLLAKLQAAGVSETFMLGLQIIIPIENNESLFRVLFLTGPTFELGFLRDR